MYIYWDYFYEIGFEFQEEITPTARLVHIHTHALNKTDKLLLNLISFPFLPDRSHVLIIGRFCRKWFIVSVAPRKRKLLCCVSSTERPSIFICRANMKNDVVLCQKGNIFYEDQKPISAPAAATAELSVSDKFPSKCLYMYNIWTCTVYAKRRYRI